MTDAGEELRRAIAAAASRRCQWSRFGGSCVAAQIPVAAAPISSHLSFGSLNPAMPPIIPDMV